MAPAKQNDTVRVHYTGKLTNGVVFDTSADREPLEFVIGEAQVIPGFEQAVIGMTPGDRKVALIPVGEAYGGFIDELVQEMDRAEFPPDMEIEVGQQFQASMGGQADIILTVVDVSDDTVVVDANHPLAGKDLIFEIDLVEVVAPEA